MGTTIAPKRESPSSSRTLHHGGVGKQPSRGWRSRGWIPLAYPRSAILPDRNNDESSQGEGDVPSKSLNQFFPLHSSVIKAAVREFALIEGIVDKSTLEVTVSENESEQDCHDNENQVVLQDNDSGIITKRKRKSEETGENFMAEQEEPGHYTNGSSRLHLLVHPIPSTAQALVESIVEKTPTQNRVSLYHQEYELARPPTKKMCQSDHQENTAHSPVTRALHELNRPPRKVSDSDHTFVSITALADMPLSKTSLSGGGAARVVEQVLGPLDISRFWDGLLSGTIPTGEQTEHIPQLMEASISTEMNLRSIAIRMTTHLVEPFQDSTLRLFLGYKSPALTRERLVHVLADVLFDTSHAFFAWEQTERDLRNQLQYQTSTRNRREELDVDTRVKESLFDDRALRKIGGFHKSSLLPQALSIDRLQKRNESWENFAKTESGKQMLEHHHDIDQIILAGQRRRGQRLRQRTAGKTGVAPGQRSRSSSIASSSDEEAPISPTEASSLTFGDELFAGISLTSDVHLTREENTSWGVLLAKEGDVCVVVRGGDGCNGSSHLHSGDLLLWARNERGEIAFSPSFRSKGEETADWFRSMVNLFKTSNELDVVVQRVGGSHQG